MTKPVPTPNDLKPRARAGKRRDRPSRELQEIFRMRRYRRTRRARKLPGSEIYGDLLKSLHEVKDKLLSGKFDGHPDRVDEAFMNLSKLVLDAYENLRELHRKKDKHALWY
jgi:hypothetical protein